MRCKEGFSIRHGGSRVVYQLQLHLNSARRIDLCVTPPNLHNDRWNGVFAFFFLSFPRFLLILSPPPPGLSKKMRFVVNAREWKSENLKNTSIVWAVVLSRTNPTKLGDRLFRKTSFLYCFHATYWLKTRGALSGQAVSEISERNEFRVDLRFRKCPGFETTRNCEGLVNNLSYLFLKKNQTSGVKIA